ncbi:coiled-coil domain-containing protein 127 [Poecilia reticulata]|uniref:Coiled-coil domain containing 127a n=1 Tax=Poecilia reticulata TaxID=8081 RepID=A0A3P9PF62_POERE|nr:PREDICTED: coiled-coil domain-containing protein 127 [Poecilia reticulata]XP_008430257.1 PREDICTED: coiled-coil domain-containing protein 127 [Poecilia reticulata]
MNNLNNPPRWNIHPNQGSGDAGARGDGGASGGNKWNYALLVPMLGLAAFRWIWTRNSENEIQKIKVQYDKDVSVIKSEMEARYRDTLTESRRAVATLELEVEKEQQRVKGYQQALVSHSQHLIQERKRLEQERDALNDEKQKLVKSGATGAVLRDALEREAEWHQRATATLRELEGLLVERQNAYCSLIQPRDQRLEMEKNMLLKVVKNPIAAELGLESDLKDIFKRDRHCADLMNMDKRKNGSLMWVYLKYWQLQITLQKHKRAEEAILDGRIQGHRK